MADATTISGLPFPEGSDANNVPSDMADLATALDGTIIKKLTAVEIAALAAGEKPAGTVVYNTTTGKVQKSNGSTFVDVIDAAGGTMAAALAMGSQKITGLAAGTTAGNAVRYEQVLLLAGGTMSGNIDVGDNYLLNVKASGASADAATVGQVAAVQARFTGGIKTATTGSNGEVTVTLPESPTGNWAVTVTGTAVDGSGGTGYGPMFYVTATSSTSATVRAARSSTGAYITSTSVTFLYTAVAY